MSAAILYKLVQKPSLRRDYPGIYAANSFIILRAGLCTKTRVV